MPSVKLEFIYITFTEKSQCVLPVRELLFWFYPVKKCQLMPLSKSTEEQSVNGKKDPTPSILPASEILSG